MHLDLRTFDPVAVDTLLRAQKYFLSEPSLRQTNTQTLDHPSLLIKAPPPLQETTSNYSAVKCYGR